MSPEGKRRSSIPRDLRDVYQQKEPPLVEIQPETPLEKEFEQPPDIPFQHVVKAFEKVVFQVGHRKVKRRDDLRLPRRNVVVALRQPNDPDQTIFARITSGAADWIGSIPTVGIHGVRRVGHEKLPKKARQAARQKRKIGLR
ncbi:hypothetical protein M1271_00960 [Patescibacteria group bacterium]|nr:hypothetical protein [Patescibacteria group bacterium]